MKYLACLICLIMIWSVAGMAAAENVPISEATEFCLECHVDATPGVVADWKRSRHAQVTVGQALAVTGAARKVSADDIPDELNGVAVGCAECHTNAPESHADSFDHEGNQVHTVVTPPDCGRCHNTEADQFQQNKMAHAYGNLVNNALYRDFMTAVNGDYQLRGGRLVLTPANDMTEASSCLKCHGTTVKVTGFEPRETDFGDYDFPVFSGWPNQGVGRVNPDGSKGTCSACHTRHQFSMAMARKPGTCSQCHTGPDVLAYKIYKVSKHGNIYSSLHQEWDFKPTPWVLGRDFSAPTCAVCHISQVEDTAGNQVAKRTHQMNDRLPWRLLGLVYAHPQPKTPETDKIVSPDGLPLPTGLEGTLAAGALINQATVDQRTQTIQRVCLGCHGPEWVKGHWDLLENTIKSSNGQVRAATGLMMDAWQKGMAHGWAKTPDQRGNLFDESLERQWTRIWFFHANSIRLSAAMGGADYGVFDNGRFPLGTALTDMAETMERARDASPEAP